MTGRGIFLILTLYTALVWVVVGIYRQDQLLYFGLLGTAVGLAVALVGVIVQQIVGVVRAQKARSAAKPPQEKPKAIALGEDAAALEALRREAGNRLSEAAKHGRLGGKAFAGRPMYLVIGPPDSGKTKVVMNSGLDPQLLAGQVRGDTSVLPTRVANFWLAKESLFVELSGRLYESDQQRWASLLSVLKSGAGTSWWSRLWRGGQAPQLRGVLLVHDIQSAIPQPEFALGAAHSRVARERLQAVADAFGMVVPVYAIFSKTDSVKFFSEYFGRLPQSEAAEAFGYTLANEPAVTPSRPLPWAETEGRRLTRAFSAVYRRLADRRLLHLVRESDSSRKPDIYEFPREFRRIRGSLVQILTDAFQPEPLKPGHQLRGFYFTGTRMAEEPIAEPTLPGLEATSRAAHGVAGKADYRDATRIFQPGEFRLPGREEPIVSGRSTLRQQWLFTKQLFLETIPRDLPPVVGGPSQSILDKYRVPVTLTVAGLVLVLCGLWLNSWWLNREMIQRAESAVQQVVKERGASSPEAASLGLLQALDRVREEMTAIERRSLWTRWGLSRARAVYETLGRVYFRHLGDVLLVRLNAQLGDRLARLPSEPDNSNPFDPEYKRLASHLAMTSNLCGHDPKVVHAVLMQEAREGDFVGEGEIYRLIDRQIEFYARSLRKGIPLSLSENQLGREQARIYLSKVRGVQWIYEIILDRTRAKLPGQVPLDRGIADFLAGPAVMPAAFTPTGWKTFVEEAKEAPNVAQGDACVLGSTSGTLLEHRQSVGLVREVKSRYLTQYVEEWRNFLSQQKLPRYSGRNDAIQKLERLSAGGSPILGVLDFVSRNTNLPQDESGISEAVKSKIGFGKEPEKTRQLSDDSPLLIAKVFQPVHAVVPPESQNWASSERSQPYVNALAEFGGSLKQLERLSSSTTDDAAHQQATAARDKATDVVRQITLAFNASDSAGVNAIVEGLLRAPIDQARGLYIENAARARAGSAEKALGDFCSAARPILNKYPFRQTSTEDASLEEVSRLFHPESGRLAGLLATLAQDLVVRTEGRWVVKPDAPTPPASRELLAFLNWAQEFADVLYSEGTAGPRMRYELRPIRVKEQNNVSITLSFDGRKVVWDKDATLRGDFEWPAPMTESRSADGWVSTGSSQNYFAGGEGLWGVFRVFGGADPRPLTSREVRWSQVTVSGDVKRPFNPPVRVDFVGGLPAYKVLNPVFYDNARCPGRAVQ